MLGGIVKVFIFRRKSFSNIPMKLCSDHILFCEKSQFSHWWISPAHKVRGVREMSPFQSEWSWSPLLLGHFQVWNQQETHWQGLLCLETSKPGPEQTPRWPVPSGARLTEAEEPAWWLCPPSPHAARSSILASSPARAGTAVCNLSEELARVDWCMDVFTFSRHSWSVFSSKHFKAALFISPRGAEFSVALRKLWALWFWVHKEPKDKRNNFV